MRWLWRSAAMGAALVLASVAEAQLRPQPRPADTATSALADKTADGTDLHTTSALQSIGPVTGLPLPRFASLKADEGNARRGPALDQRVDWVFVREDMPLQITAEYDNWRRVEDSDGEGGWVHYSLLSGSRTIIVKQDRLLLRVRPEEDATEIALLEQDVVARLETCELDWCRIRAGGYSGWARKTDLWGVSPDEVLD